MTPATLAPFPLAPNDSRSVLAVKGTLRRFAPWTAPGRSEAMTVYEGKGGVCAVGSEGESLILAQDHATALELAVLTRDTDGAPRLLADALAAVREHWEPESTSRNLRLIREARTRRGENAAWIETLEKELSRAAVQCSFREP